jgi:septal ring-binding cell division protein DamX
LRRFAAELPNECWRPMSPTGPQPTAPRWTSSPSSTTTPAYWPPPERSSPAKAADVVETFHQGAAEPGAPTPMLTDNRATFTAESRQGSSAIELELIA